MARDDAPENLSTRLWCGGRPFLERRALTIDEVALLEHRADGLRRATLASAGVAVLLAATPPVLLLAFGWRTAVVAHGAALLGSALAAIFFVPILALLARDRGREWRRHRADLAGGEALVFATPRRRADDVDEGPPIVVFPASRTTWVRPRRRDRLCPVEIREVAAPPSYAMRVPVPREIAWVPGHPDARFQRRSLTEAEAGELSRYIARFRRPRADTFVAAAFLAFSVGGWIAWIRSPFREAATGGDIFGGLTGLAVGALGVTHYLRLRQIASGLARDLTDGWVLALDPDSAEAVADDRPDAAAPGREFLPNSRLSWSESGAPADWRGL